MNITKCILTLIALASLAGTLPLHAQMLNPNIDKSNEPFCYFSQPTDEIGVMDGKSGTLVSPEGYLYTGFGELMFFTDNPPQPVHQRVKTLREGYLPIIEYTFEREGFQYKFSMFAATLDGNPESPLMNFVRVAIKNAGNRQRTTHFAVGTRYQNQSNMLGVLATIGSAVHGPPSIPAHSFRLASSSAKSGNTAFHRMLFSGMGRFFISSPPHRSRNK